MTAKKIVKFNVLNLVIFALLFTTLFLSYKQIEEANEAAEAHRKTTKTVWRQQSLRTLESLREKFNYDTELNITDPLDDKSVQEWANSNLKNVKNGGDASNGFIIAIPAEKYIWDATSECQQPEYLIAGKYIVDEITMTKHPKLAETVLDEMRKLYDTTSSAKENYWEYADSTELLEWVILPNANTGFNNESKTIGGIKNEDYKSFILVLATQEEEILAPYSDFYKNLDARKTDSIIICVLVLLGGISILSVYVFKGNPRGSI